MFDNDRGNSCIRIVRPYVGKSTDVKSRWMIVQHRKIDRYDNFPTREALRAYEHIARKARAYAGMPKS